jgi:hypothetical protein
MGLVRVAHGADQREASVDMTESGLDVLRRGDPLWDHVQHGIEARLGPTGVAQLRELLQAL